MGLLLHPPKCFSWQRMEVLGHLLSSKYLDIFGCPSVGQAWLPALGAQRLSIGKRGLLGVCTAVQYISVPGPWHGMRMGLTEGGKLLLSCSHVSSLLRGAFICSLTQSAFASSEKPWHYKGEYPSPSSLCLLPSHSQEGACRMRRVLCDGQHLAPSTQPASSSAPKHKKSPF